jgi:phosphoglucosamine mutase
LSSIPEIDKVIKEAENHFGDDGRVIIRYSGTEPLCRVMGEGRVKEEVEKYANQIAEAVKNKLN